MRLETVNLGEISKIVSGSTPKTNKSEYWGGSIQWATPTDLSGLSTKELASTGRTITKEGFESCSATMLPPRSVLFSSRAPIGLVAINKYPLCTNQGFKSFIPNANRLSADFLYWWLKVNRPSIERLGRGATFKEVSKSIVEKIQIPLPPLAEQKRIAGILDAADALRAKRRESLAQLDTLLQSSFLDMFGEQECQAWKTEPVETIAKPGKNFIRTGPFGSQLLHSEFVDEGVGVLGIDNVVENIFRTGQPRYISEKKYRLLKRYTVSPGDVLITIMGTCGRCAIVPNDIGTAINTKHLCCITLDKAKCLPSFLHSYFLRHPIARRYLEQNAKGAIMAGLNMGIIKRLPVPIPPIDLQHRFATIVESIEKQKSRLRAHLAELDTLFASLQSRAFNGEL